MGSVGQLVRPCVHGSCLLGYRVPELVKWCDWTLWKQRLMFKFITKSSWTWHCGFRWWHQLHSCTSEVLGGRVCVQCGRLVSATCWRCCSAEGSTAPWGSSQWWGHPEHISWLFLEDEPATFCQPLWSQTGCPLCGCWLFPPTPATKQEKKQSYWLKVSFSALKLEWKTFNSKP